MNEVNVDFAQVSSLLWREREALEHLLYTLTVERLVVASGEIRWLAPANREVEACVADLRGIEVIRAAEVDALADALGIQTFGATLRELAAVADEPWRSILEEHREGLIALIAEIDAASEANRVLLTAGARAVRDTLLSITDDVEVYDARGKATSAGQRPYVVDEQA